MAITNINPDKAGLPRWAEHGLFRSLSRYEGPAETAKMLLSGRWDFTPRRLWERVNAYNDELLKYARRHYVDILTVVWSPGFSHQGDQIQWQILRDYIRKAHRRGIRIIAYHSLTNCFWQEMFAAEPQARQWRQLSHDGGDVPYMAATYHGQVSRILLCVNNREWREYLKYKVRMALEAGVDGLFFDNLFSKCFCPICRQGFADYTRRLYGQAYEMPAPEPISEAELQARTGIEVIADSERNLPQDRSFLHLARSQYWNDSTADFLRELWEMTRRIKPDAIFRHNAHERWPMNEIGNFKLSEDNRPCSYDPAGGAMWTNFGLWKYLFEDGGRQKPFVNGVRSKVDWAEINACGGDAPSIVDADYQAFHKKYGRQIYHNTQPLGRVAVMIRGLSPVAERAPFFTHLARHNVQFDVMIYEQADRYDWKLYSLIVLFDVRCMSDQIADRLRAFVSAGGNLIATGPSGLGTEHWLGRDEYALADVYGVSLREGPTGRLENRFGKGQVVFYPDSIGQKLQQGQADELCQRFIDDVRRLAGRAVLEIEAPDGVVATLMGRGRNKRIVHLINYRPEPIDGVVVRLPGWRFEQVELLSPDQPGPRLEQVGVDEQGLRFRVDGLAVYAVAVAGRR